MEQTENQDVVSSVRDFVNDQVFLTELADSIARGYLAAKAVPDGFWDQDEEASVARIAIAMHYGMSKWGWNPHDCLRYLFWAENGLTAYGEGLTAIMRQAVENWDCFIEDSDSDNPCAMCEGTVDGRLVNEVYDAKVAKEAGLWPKFDKEKGTWYKIDEQGNRYEDAWTFDPVNKLRWGAMARFIRHHVAAGVGLAWDAEKPGQERKFNKAPAKGKPAPTPAREFEEEEIEEVKLPGGRAKLDTLIAFYEENKSKLSLEQQERLAERIASKRDEEDTDGEKAEKAEEVIEEIVDDLPFGYPETDEPDPEPIEAKEETSEEEVSFQVVEGIMPKLVEIASGEFPWITDKQKKLLEAISVESVAGNKDAYQEIVEWHDLAIQTKEAAAAADTMAMKIKTFRDNGFTGKWMIDLCRTL